MLKDMKELRGARMGLGFAMARGRKRKGIERKGIERKRGVRACVKLCEGDCIPG